MLRSVLFTGSPRNMDALTLSLFTLILLAVSAPMTILLPEFGEDLRIDEIVLYPTPYIRYSSAKWPLQLVKSTHVSDVRLSFPKLRPSLQFLSRKSSEIAA